MVIIGENVIYFRDLKLVRQKSDSMPEEPWLYYLVSGDQTIDCENPVSHMEVIATDIIIDKNLLVEIFREIINNEKT